MQLIKQSDGNLVLKQANGTICWAAGTRPYGQRVAHQRDGNFVVHSSGSTALRAGCASTGTSVDIDSDGDLRAGTKLIARC